MQVEIRRTIYNKNSLTQFVTRVTFVTIITNLGAMEMNFFQGIVKGFMTRSTWPRALLWLVASETVYFIMLGVTIPSIEDKAIGMRILDLKTTGYSSSYVTSFLERIGSEGRHNYLIHQIPLDMIYPSLMAVTGALFIALLTRKINPRLGVLMMIPFFGAIFDYLENITVVEMLLSYPSLPQGITRVASLFTIMKTVLDTLYLGVLGVLFLISIFKIVRSPQKK